MKSHKRNVDGSLLSGSDILDSLYEQDAQTGSPTEAEPQSETHRDDPAPVRRSPISPSILQTLVAVIEGLIIAGIGFAVWVFYLRDFSGIAMHIYLPVILIAGIFVPVVNHAGGLYRLSTLIRCLPELSRVAVFWTLIVGAIMVVMFFLKAGEEYSRFWMVGWYLGGLAGLSLYRVGIAGLVRRWNKDGRFDQLVAIVGGGKPVEELIDALEGTANVNIRIAGFFDDRSNDRSPGSIKGYRKLGNYDDLIKYARTHRLDLLIVALPITAERRLLEVLKRLWILPLDIRLSAYTHKLRFRPRTYSYVGNVPVFDVFDKPLSEWDIVVKAVEDRVLAGLMLAILAPVMAMVALAVKLDSRGPVLFKQKRYGFNNELIEVYKFRSMRTDMTDADARQLVTKNDPRVTRVGRFIRKTSLDELPQLFNVLKGELSLVGPRPHATQAKAADRLYTEVVEGYFARHKVKPGVTGWAQVNGWRGETDTEEKIRRRVEHDLYYIENWSVLFDLYILARTPLALLNTNSAY